MFKTVESRYALRGVIVGIGTLLSSLAASASGSSLTWGELIIALSSGWAGALGYYGVGYLSKSVEPSIGNK
jgi:hypothetical protein